MIKNYLLEADVNLYGSTASGFCLKDSLIDIEITIENQSSDPIFNLINDFILKNNDYLSIDLDSINIDNDDSSITCKLKDTADNINFQFTFNKNPFSYRTSRLFYFYSKLDCRFKLLAFCFRYLAKVSELFNFRY